MSRPHVTLVVNPASGVGRAAGLAEAVASRLRRGAEVEVCAGDSPAQSQELVAAAAASGTDLVAVLGGDGIVHLAVQALAGGNTPLGVVPAGTGNDVADLLGIPPDPLAAADALLTALAAQSVRRVDLGRTDADRWWSTVLCAGFDSAVNERANRMRWPRGPRRYDLAIAAELSRLRPRQFRLTLDGQTHELAATLVAVGNGPQYGGGKQITPDARLDSGAFQVTVVGPVTRWQLVRIAPTLPHAGHIGHPQVRTFQAREVRIEAADTLGYADGERVAALPITTVCVAGALPVLVPPHAVPRGLGRPA